MILEFFSPEGQAVISQSQGQGKGRGGGGVAKHPGMGGERGPLKGPFHIPARMVEMGGRRMQQPICQPALHRS